MKEIEIVSGTFILTEQKQLIQLSVERIGEHLLCRSKTLCSWTPRKQKKSGVLYIMCIMRGATTRSLSSTMLPCGARL